MVTNRRFSAALQALTELKTDESESPASRDLVPAVPTLSDVLAKIGSIPAEALFLGIASDGLPVLLNLHDANPGPMLISGDPGAGKTTFLQTIAQALTQTHRAADVRFGVITNYPDEWQGFQATPHRIGVFPVGHSSAGEFIESLAAWAHSKKPAEQCNILLVDDLESVATLDPSSLQNFRWLLLRGPARRVWPIVTLSAPRYGQVISWLSNFRARIFGRVANPQVAEALGAVHASLDQLEPGVFFSMREKDPRSRLAENWLRFWLPSC